MRRTRRLGEAGRRAALRLLAASGYEVVEEEPVAEGVLLLDGVRQRYHVRADALVQRGRRRLVAEFKGGPKAVRPTRRDTRRQLLEYAIVYEADGVLLVDGLAGRLVEVRFEGLGGPANRPRRGGRPRRGAKSGFRAARSAARGRETDAPIDYPG